MFGFFDGNQNPFMMMNMFAGEDFGEQEDQDEKVGMNPMMFMQQAFMLQMQMMQLMQTMFMMPLQMMTSLLPMMESFNPMSNAEEFPEKLKGLKDKMGSMTGGDEGSKDGFKLGNFSIPPAMIGKLMQMDMSPENLEKLQGILDFVFEIMPNKKSDSESEE